MAALALGYTAQLENHQPRGENGVSDSTGDSQEFQISLKTTFVEDRLLDSTMLEDDDEGGRPREGLPPTFQMRHDAHYVDELMERSLRGGATQAADAAPIAAAPHNSGGPGALSAAIATELAESLNAADACLSLNTGETRHTFAGRAARDLLRIELQRAARIASAAALMASPLVLNARDLAVSGLVHDVVDATEAARRMLGVKLDVAIADRESWMRADMRLLTLAVSGSADAMLAQATAPATMRLAVKGGSVSPTVSFEISMPLPATPAIAGFFDANDANHPWGAWAALLLGAAAHIAEAHRGHAEIRSSTPGEVTIAYHLPRR